MTGSTFSGLVAAILKRIYAASRASPSLLSSLRRHFPRPLLVRACLNLPFTSNKVLYEWTRAHSTSSGVSDILGVWIVADGLSWTSHIDGMCMRRGCGQKRRKRCAACGTVEYCGVVCQTEYVARFPFSRASSPLKTADMMMVHLAALGTGPNIACFVGSKTGGCGALSIPAQMTKESIIHPHQNGFRFASRN